MKEWCIKDKEILYAGRKCSKNTKWIVPAFSHGRSHSDAIPRDGLNIVLKWDESLLIPSCFPAPWVFLLTEAAPSVARSAEKLVYPGVFGGSMLKVSKVLLTTLDCSSQF